MSSDGPRQPLPRLFGLASATPVRRERYEELMLKCPKCGRYLPVCTCKRTKIVQALNK